MAKHSEETGLSIHVINAVTYTNIAARDADTDFNTDSENVNKIVRVDSPESYFILSSTSPTFLELSNTAFNTLAEILVGGNTSGGTDLIISTDDDLLVTDHMSVGSTDAPATDTSIDLKATNVAILINRLTTTQRDTLTALQGMIIYNTTTDDIEFFNGVDWQSMPGGDVVGPPSSTDNAIAIWNGTSGGNIQDSNVLIDNDNVTGMATLVVGITVVPDGTLHIHTASAGSVGSTSSADDLTVENSADAGITILTPDVNISALNFGSPNRQTGAFLRWNNSTGTFNIGTGDIDAELIFETGFSLEAMRLAPSGELLIGTTTLEPSAKLEVASTTQGFLPPRMTETQRDAIASPAAGLMIFNTTTNAGNAFNGTEWRAANTTPA